MLLSFLRLTVFQSSNLMWHRPMTNYVLFQCNVIFGRHGRYVLLCFFNLSCFCPRLRLIFYFVDFRNFWFSFWWAAMFTPFLASWFVTSFDWIQRSELLWVIWLISPRCTLWVYAMLIEPKLRDERHFLPWERPFRFLRPGCLQYLESL